MEIVQDEEHELIQTNQIKPKTKKLRLILCKESGFDWLTLKIFLRITRAVTKSLRSRVFQQLLIWLSLDNVQQAIFFMGIQYSTNVQLSTIPYVFLNT